MDAIKTWLATYALWLALGAISGACAFAGVQTVRLARAQRALAEVTATNAKAQASAQAAARAIEQTTAELSNVAAAYYEKGKSNAHTAQGALLADLLSVRVRLQSRWQCPSAAVVPRAGSAAGESDAADRDRFESASRAIGAADECDQQNQALRMQVCADRGKRLVGTECVR